MVIWISYFSLIYWLVAVTEFSIFFLSSFCLIAINIKNLPAKISHSIETTCTSIFHISMKSTLIFVHISTTLFFLHRRNFPIMIAIQSIVLLTAMQSYLDDDSRTKREKQTSDTQFIGFFPSLEMLSNLCRNITNGLKREMARVRDREKEMAK